MNDLVRQSLYATHLPVLTRILDMTNGPVLELGMGPWSTPVIDFMCRETKRKIVSYDNDEIWFEKNKQWKSDYHDVHFVPHVMTMVDMKKKKSEAVYDWGSIDIDNQHWNVALVDHKPARRRIDEIKRLKSNTELIIIHDSEPEQDKFFKYSWIYKHFKYRYNYTKCLPNTTVLSNFFDLRFLERQVLP